MAGDSTGSVMRAGDVGRAARRVLVVADGRVVHESPAERIDSSGVLEHVLAVHEHGSPTTTTDERGDVA